VTERVRSEQVLGGRVRERRSDVERLVAVRRDPRREDRNEDPKDCNDEARYCERPPEEATAQQPSAPRSRAWSGYLDVAQAALPETRILGFSNEYTRSTARFTRT
jgi:hypothetical protein